jgi:hypothetical protein
MHRHLKADARAHDADRHPQVAGGADGDAVLAEELFKFRGQQLAIVVFGVQQPASSASFSAWVSTS